MGKKAQKLMRGSNQSADTKWASCLVCKAIDLIESGQISRAVPLLYQAAGCLPDMGHRANTEDPYAHLRAFDCQYQMEVSGGDHE